MSAYSSILDASVEDVFVWLTHEPLMIAEQSDRTNGLVSEKNAAKLLNRGLAKKVLNSDDGETYLVLA